MENLVHNSIKFLQVKYFCKNVQIEVQLTLFSVDTMCAKSIQAAPVSVT